MVSADAPALTVRLGAFDVVPPVVPNTTVAVAAMFLVNPPVPVKVKPVAVAIDKTVVAAVVLVSAMLPEPKEIARVLLLLELKIPVLKVKLARSSVPAVSVVVLVVSAVIASTSVTVPAAVLTVVLPSVLPTLVTDAVARNVGAREVNVPPDDKVKFWYMEIEPEAVQLLPVNVNALNPVPLKVSA